MSKNPLRLVGNVHAVTRMSRKAGVWPQQAAPIHVADTQAIARAKSLVVATRGHVDLTPEEARAIIAEWEAKA